jgi:hypothetical protein
MKDFVPYQEALELKELEFNEPCFATYDEDKEFEIQDFEQTYDTFPSHIIAAPLFSQVFDFFREKHKLEGQVKSWKEKGNIVFHYSVQPLGEPSVFRSIDCYGA